MKKYDVSDFRCFFARQNAEEALKSIDLSVLERFQGTDIRVKLRDAMMAEMERTGFPPEVLPFDHPNLILSNGESVQSQTQMLMGNH